MATAVSRLGFYFGEPSDFNAPDSQNPGGNWELKDLQVLNARALQSFGMDYFQADPLPRNWPSLPASNQFVAEIRDVLKKHFRGRDFWAWKEPSTTMLMPLYKAALESEDVTPRYAICVRHPKSVAKSMRSRQSAWGYEAKEDDSAHAYPIESRTVGLWVLYTLAALRESAGRKRVLFYYDHFLERPEPYLTALTDGLGHRASSEARIAEASEALKPEWRHTRFGPEDLTHYPEIVRATYDLVLRADGKPDGLTEGKFDDEIESLWNQWIDVSNLTKPIPLPAGHMSILWKDGAEIKQQTVHFSPHGDWRTVATELAVPPNAPIQVDIYQTPCQVWIKRAEWDIGGRRQPANMKAGPNGLLEHLWMPLLTVFGPGSLVVQAPKEGKGRLILEILVMDDSATLTRIIAMMRDRLGSVQREFANAFRMRR